MVDILFHVLLWFLIATVFGSAVTYVYCTVWPYKKRLGPWFYTLMIWLNVAQAIAVAVLVWGP